VPVGQRDEFGEVEHGDVDVFVGTLEGGLVEIELLEAARTDDHERVDLLALDVDELAARERERGVALADAVERAAAALHLGRVVDDARAERLDDLLDLGRVERVVPAHGGLRTKQVAAVVDRDAHAPQRLDGLGGHEPGAHLVGEPLGEVNDLVRAGVAAGPRWPGAR
jgi:hypothetical protein